jgi:hypothetical protein
LGVANVARHTSHITHATRHTPHATRHTPHLQDFVNRQQSLLEQVETQLLKLGPGDFLIEIFAAFEIRQLDRCLHLYARDANDTDPAHTMSNTTRTGTWEESCRLTSSLALRSFSTACKSPLMLAAA